MSLSRFRERLVETQNEILKEKDYIGAAYNRLSFRPGAYRRTKRLPLIAAGIAVLAVGAAVLYLIVNDVRPKTAATALLNGRPVSPGEWIFGSPDSDKTLSFPDGSDLSLFRKAGVRIHSLHPNGAHVSLEHGGVSAHIVHQKTTAWVVNVGPFTIEVKGTRFDIDWSPERQSFHLDLTEGVVRINGPMLGEGRLMKAGEKMYASLSDERIEIEDADHLKTIIFNGKETAATKTSAGDNAHDQAMNISSIADDAPSNSLVKPRSHRAGSKWQSLAKAGKYKDAIASAKQLGVPEILKKESAATLMMLGDTARRARVFDIATEAYRVVRRRFPRTTHASGAAFALGLIAFDHRRDYRHAAKWFETCAQFDPQGAFTREAAGRLMESLDRAGDSARARAAAEKYMVRFPGGPHARLAEKLLTMH